MVLGHMCDLRDSIYRTLLMVCVIEPCGGADPCVTQVQLTFVVGRLDCSTMTSSWYNS